MDRKEAIREYKARKAPRGVFAVRSTATGHVWVGSSPDLDAAQNALWFMLRNGSHYDRTLQTEWDSHGEQSFRYEILEKLDDDVSALRVYDVLKQQKLKWVAQLDATALIR